MTDSHGPLSDLLDNLTGHAAGSYGSNGHDNADHVSETQGPIGADQSPLKRHPGDAEEEAERPQTLDDDGGDGGL